jgi:hypothetical protein
MYFEDIGTLSFPPAEREALAQFCFTKTMQTYIRCTGERDDMIDVEEVLRERAHAS